MLTMLSTALILTRCPRKSTEIAAQAGFHWLIKQVRCILLEASELGPAWLGMRRCQAAEPADVSRKDTWNQVPPVSTELSQL